MMAVLALCSLFIINTVCAQDNNHVDLRIEARGDYQNEMHDGGLYEPNSGFRGRFLNLRLDGNITDSWSYSYRHRLANPANDATYFDAVDWVQLLYTTDQWTFAGGKQSVIVGGYEYGCAPIDFYFGSEYWYNMACFQWGMSAQYAFGDEAANTLKLQVCQSPFRKVSPEMMGYNLLWTASYGWLDLLHSVNMMEYHPGKFVNFIALGHQFNMGNMALQLDFMNRADMSNFAIGKDMLLMADLAWNAADQLKIFGKISYDVNEDNGADLCVLPGTELTRLGAGVEYFPIKGSRDIRFHGTYSYTWGKNANADGTLFGDQSFLSLGVTWKMSVLKR